MNIGSILIFCILSFLQLYILFLIAIYGHFRKILNNSTGKLISQIVCNFTFPIYIMLEVSRIGNIENLRIFYLLILSTVISIVTAFIISKYFCYLFKLDVRIFNSFSILSSLPSLGSTPLVLGRAFCLDGGPLYGDKNCDYILGYMVICTMTFQIFMFYIGNILVLRDTYISKPLEEKISYMWYILVKNKLNEDLIVKELFKKYFKDSSKVQEKYNHFMSNYEINQIDGLHYEFNIEEETGDSCKISYYSINHHIPKNEVVKNFLYYFDERDDFPEDQNNSENVINSTEEDENKDFIKIFRSLDMIEKYYNKIFQIIEENIDDKYKEEYIIQKNDIMKDITYFPPKFPFVRSIRLNEELSSYINIQWETFEKNVNIYYPEFKLSIEEFPSFSSIIGKIYFPPIIGCFLGLIIGFSGMRNILFSDNILLKNLFDAFSVVSGSNVPFMFITIGLSLISTKKLGGNMILTKKEVVLGHVLRYFIIPILGLFYIYLFKILYGGVVAESKVMRYSMFIPFGLPNSMSLVVFFNKVNFYIDESSYQILTQQITMIFGMTLIYVVFYSTIGI